jgi:hypothetical protein
MNTENVSGDQKRDWKRKLLPLAALIVGLAVPVYAFAASEAECTYCHNTCTSNFNSARDYCEMMYKVPCDSGNWYECQRYYDCYGEAVNNYIACHTYCGTTPGGPCIE